MFNFETDQQVFFFGFFFFILPRELPRGLTGGSLSGGLGREGGWFQLGLKSCDSFSPGIEDQKTRGQEGGGGVEMACPIHQSQNVPKAELVT